MLNKVVMPKIIKKHSSTKFSPIWFQKLKLYILYII